MSDVPEESGESAGLPMWMATFADLMTLLMCFFVLLLSFSEMDVAKFKQMAGSMEQAFGVQAEIEVKMIPRGTSIIAQEFSPGTPEPTVMNEVRQYTVNSNQSTLDVGQERGEEGGEGKGDGGGDGEGEAEQISLEDAERLAKCQAEQLREALADEIAEGSLEVRLEGTDVTVQILEQDSFASGSSLLEAGFRPTLDRIGTMLNTMVGAIRIAGHTDDVPISTSQFRSNWDLSAMRATTVAHQLLTTGINPGRMMVSGHADTQPRAPNDTPANRALNRRIDITLITSRFDHLPAPVSREEEAPAEAVDEAESIDGRDNVEGAIDNDRVADPAVAAEAA
jgi:chemotaxis protein MotB